MAQGSDAVGCKFIEENSWACVEKKMYTADWSAYPPELLLSL